MVERLRHLTANDNKVAGSNPTMPSLGEFFSLPALLKTSRFRLTVFLLRVPKFCH